MTNEEKILDILAEMSLRMATKDDIMKIHIEMETDIKPRLDALAEGHAAIIEQLTPRSRIDNMEQEIGLLKTLVYQLSGEVSKLKAV